MTMVVDCSIIIRLLSSRDGDDLLRQRLARTLHAPALIDAEISSVVRGLTITAKPNVRISPDRAGQMLADYAGLRIARHPMRNHCRLESSSSGTTSPHTTPCTLCLPSDSHCPCSPMMPS